VTASRSTSLPNNPGVVAVLPLAALLYAVGYLVARLGPWPQPGDELATDLALLVPNSAVALAAWWRAHALATRSDRARDRRAWLLIGAAYALLAVSTVLWLAHDAALAPAPRLGPLLERARALVLVSYLPLVAGLLTFPSPRTNRRERSRILLDWGVVVLGAWMFLWEVVLRRSARFTDASVAEGLLHHGALVADFAVLIVLVGVLVRGALPRVTPALRLLVAGRVIAVIAGALSATSAFGDARPSVLSDVLWIVSLACDLLAASGWRLRLPAPGTSEDDERDLTSPGSALPYAFLAIGYGALLSSARPAWHSALGTALFTAVVLTAGVVARQLLALADIRRLTRERAAQDARFRSLVEHASDVITVVDHQLSVRFVSPSLRRVFGYAPASAPPLSALLHPDDLDPAVAMVRALMGAAPGSSATEAWRVQHADGSWRHTETIATNLLADPTVAGVVLNTRDVTERKRLEDELVHRALHDPLTGLANRVLLHDRAEQALARGLRSAREHQAVAVLLIDLDDFKKVNDSLGHGAGDMLLVAVSRRMLAATRGCDTVARLGGDEFAVLLEGMAEAEDAVRVAERILEAMRAPVHLEGKEVLVGTSIGIALAIDGEGVDELLRNADVALYQAKARGKHRHATFVPAMHAAALARLDLETDLHAALTREEFALAYQPIVELSTGRVTGAEALVRWTHPTRGAISPAEFIPLAESTGAIVALGRWVLRAACRQLATWDEESLAQGRRRSGAPLSVAVNLSTRQLQDPGLVDDVAAALTDYGLASRRLTLEITESAMMHDAEVALARLSALKALGVRLAVDDFGTGYSSLSYLRRFPVDVLKIDRSFVDGLSRTGETALVRAIVRLGDALGLKTVAEGIEHAEQLAQLRALGCGMGQGYYFARPMGEAAFQCFVQRETDGAREAG
jgi:diguanylate cyclase (GGDEF)-like protein/PAS domain S-box-containing protein